MDRQTHVASRSRERDDGAAICVDPSEFLSQRHRGGASPAALQPLTEIDIPGPRGRGERACSCILTMPASRTYVFHVHQLGIKDIDGYSHVWHSAALGPRRGASERAAERKLHAS